MTVQEAIEKLKSLPPDAKIEALVVNLLSRSVAGQIGLSQAKAANALNGLYRQG